MIFVDYPGHFFAIALLAVLTALIALAFRTDKLKKLKRWARLLMLLQYVAVLILLLIMWNPSSQRTVENMSTNSVLVFFDTSRSMSIAETGTRNRLRKALELFDKKFRSADNEGPNFRIYGFDNHSYYCYQTDALRKWGEHSNMHSIFDVIDKYQAKGPPGGSEQAAPAGNVAGAIIFTDGQANNKNINAYPARFDEDLPIIIVGVGSATPKPDVAIQRMQVPSRAAIDTAYSVQVPVTVKCLYNDTVTVELSKDDHIIDTQQLSTSNVYEQNLRAQFAVGANTLGRHILTAKATITGEEVNPANNIRSTMIEVVEQTQMKVLFYSQVLNPDIGKVRQALARDKKVKMSLGLDVVTAPVLAKSAMAMYGHVRLPENAAGFYEYDVIVLGPCSADTFSDQQIEGLYSFVAKRGGGLILLPGWGEYDPLQWANPKARALAPAVADTQHAYDTASDQLQTQLTLEGVDSRFLTSQDLRENDDPILPYYPNFRKKPAAATLASTDKLPIVTAHRLGRGRVCMLNVSGLSAIYREDLEGGLLQKLISGLTAYVGKVTSVESAIELFAQRQNGNTSKATFNARVYDRSFNPVAGATVLLTIGDDVFHMDQAGPGHYVLSMDNVRDRSLIARVQAEIDGRFLGQKSVAIDLPGVRGEMDNVELDHRFLKTLAEKLKARYYDAGNIDENPTRIFKAQRRLQSDTQLTSTWPRWSVLIFLCAVLIANWAIRRGIGLV